MSIGPSLPPHLQYLTHRKEEESDDSDSGEDFGPRLPEVACRGPQLPPSDQPPPAAGNDSDSDDDYGPQLPPYLANRLVADSGEEDSDEDGIMVGPRPPAPGEAAISLGEASAREIEDRARRMRDRLEGKDQQEIKREDWMLELPSDKAKSFGLGPRMFSRKGAPEKGGDRSVWTDTPEMRAKKARGEVEEEEEMDEKEELEALLSHQRDSAMEKATEELRQKRGTDSLMDIHEKKLKKKKAKEEEENKDQPKERRPFDRDTDLQANRFDEAQRKLMIKKAAQLGSRFSSGAQKFL